MAIFLATIKADDSRNPTQIDYVLDFGSAHNEARWRDFCKKNIGKTVRVDKPVKSRTLPQNRFYWFYLRVISKETGNNEEDLHAFFRQKLLPKKFIKIVGKKGTYEIEDYKSTTKLTKLEFSEYLEKICAITGVSLPDPKLAGYFH